MRAPALLLACPLAALLLTGCPSPTPPADASDAAAMDAAADALDAPDAPAPDAAPDGPAADATPPWLEPWTMPARTHVPANFLWGSATAPFQIESGLANTNWGQWVQRGMIARGEVPDNGPRSDQFWMADIRTLTESGQNAYRFGVEWVRLFPDRASWDLCRTAPMATRQTACHAAANAAALAYYHALVDALRAANITPLVTVQHFTLPTYIDDVSAGSDFTMQGWMRDSIVGELAAYAGFVAGEFGNQVDWYVTINEPFVVATVGYLDGHSPPGQTFNVDALVHVANNMVRAHAAMYDAIHAADTTVGDASHSPVSPAPAAMVSIAHHVRRFYGANPNDPRDATAATHADQLFNRLFLDAIVRGNLDANANGTIDAGEPMNDPALAHRADYLGINYYSLTTIQNAAAVPLLHGLPVPDERQRGLPKTDFGWDIYPRGFFDLLTWAGSYGLPIIVTENGIADASDANRPRFLAEHLAAMTAAIAQGVRVLGYFHWATIDNFEWVAGYCPRFGLYTVDMADPMRARHARASATLYHSIITAGEVSDALLAMQPAYHSATTFCPQGPTGADAGM